MDFACMVLITLKGTAMSSNIKQKLSRLMRLSWDIQLKKNKSRSSALKAAWAIVSNDDITVHYLVRKLNHHKPVAEKVANQMELFY
jgi:hypothetical protein